MGVLLTIPGIMGGGNVLLILVWRWASICQPCSSKDQSLHSDESQWGVIGRREHQYINLAALMQAFAILVDALTSTCKCGKWRMHQVNPSASRPRRVQATAASQPGGFRMGRTYYIVFTLQMNVVSYLIYSDSLSNTYDILHTRTLVTCRANALCLSLLQVPEKSV